MHRTGVGDKRVPKNRMRHRRLEDRDTLNGGQSKGVRVLWTLSSRRLTRTFHKSAEHREPIRYGTHQGAHDLPPFLGATFDQL